MGLSMGADRDPRRDLRLLSNQSLLRETMSGLRSDDLILGALDLPHTCLTSVLCFHSTDNLPVETVDKSF